MIVMNNIVLKEDKSHLHLEYVVKYVFITNTYL